MVALKPRPTQSDAPRESVQLVETEVAHEMRCLVVPPSRTRRDAAERVDEDHSVTFPRAMHAPH